MSIAPIVKDEAVREPRDLLMNCTYTARRNIVQHLEGGIRDHAALRVLVEKYIALITACDVLGGYCRVEPVKV